MSRVVFGSPREDPLPTRAFPEDIATPDHIEEGSLVVLLDAGAWQSIQEHAKQHIHVPGSGHSVECAGILAGLPFEDPNRKIRFVAVRKAIVTDAESQTADSVSIVPESLEQAKQHASNLGLKIVGWYHTHPNFGIFLSQQDRMAINSVFNASWHLSLVFDPVKNEVGCFHGTECKRIDDHDGNVERKRNYYIVKDWPPNFWPNDPSSSGSSGSENVATNVDNVTQDDEANTGTSTEQFQAPPYHPAPAHTDTTKPRSPGVERAGEPRPPIRARPRDITLFSLIVVSFLTMFGIGGWLIFARNGTLDLEEAAVAAPENVNGNAISMSPEPSSTGTVSAATPVETTLVPTATPENSADSPIRFYIGEIESQESRTEQGHLVEVTVRDNKGNGVSKQEMILWSENDAYPRWNHDASELSRCFTDNAGKCSFEPIKLELPDVRVGFAEDELAEPVLLDLPQSAQLVQITFIAQGSAQ